MYKAKRTKTIKHILRRGWKVTFNKAKKIFTAMKDGIRVKGDTISELRLLIRYEKFYKGLIPVKTKGK